MKVEKKPKYKKIPRKKPQKIGDNFKEKKNQKDIKTQKKIKSHSNLLTHSTMSTSPILKNENMENTHHKME